MDTSADNSKMRPEAAVMAAGGGGGAGSEAARTAAERTAAQPTAAGRTAVERAAERSSVERAPVERAPVERGAIQRLSVNQWTVRSWGVRELVDGCGRHGIGAVGLWREPVADLGLARSAKLIRDAGLRVSSLCRSGFFGQPGWLDSNRAAIDEAAELGAACLVLVVGGMPDNSKKLGAARAHMADAVAQLVPYAEERQVRLALEPMHPMYCADRGVLSTLGQALDVAASHPARTVGVMVDTFHLWWDPEIGDQIQRAGRENRIAGYQVSDFLMPLPADVLLGRGMMGDGVIDFAPLCQAVHATGYAGDIEVEIFNADVWAADPDDVLARLTDRYETLIANHFTR